ncbi:MAG TPA: glutamine--tRNA ligase/YqeY domain fusion protein [Chloroflexota bacterium]|nr:glutamine--tRNA ligase/YqeY domain fusion protein [Chloroflexota bacterium]
MNEKLENDTATSIALSAGVATPTEPLDFIRRQVEEDLRTGYFNGVVMTRFPPEPNGYLHIGHVKAICVDFGIAEDYGGACNLRFDDTNPVKEETEFVESMIEDIHWLGFEWKELLYASDYFDQLYEWAVQLIKDGKAYVDDLSPDEIREHRGTLTEPGKNSPFRDRSVAENLDLFERMKNGEFPEESRVLRAKIDMASPIINLRDPVMYRILHTPHHRIGDKWCIYPMYDWAHGQSDSMEGITYSLCSLEYVNHRPLYDWFLDQLGIHHPRQIEFARLALTYTITSKRRLRRLVEEGYVSGWDDPRMPTIRGMRRRGYTAAAMRNLIALTGISTANSTVDFGLVEYAVREDLNKVAPRGMAVLRPLRLTITNYPDDQEEWFDIPTYPQDKENTAVHQAPFSKEIVIEQDDFMEDAPPKFFRLAPGREVRLLGAYLVTCTDVVKDEAGHITEIHCTYDPATRGGNAVDGRKVKGTIHWVSARHGVTAELRLYDRLFDKADPEAVEEGQDFTANLNPHSLETLDNALVEPFVADPASGDHFQFMRQGYFHRDPDSTPDKPIFNLTVNLKDTWAKVSGG